MDSCPKNLLERMVEVNDIQAEKKFLTSIFKSEKAYGLVPHQEIINKLKALESLTIVDYFILERVFKVRVLEIYKYFKVTSGVPLETVLRP